MKNRLAIAITLLLLGSASADDVLPTIGGDQVGMMNGAPMKHASVSFVDNNLSIHLGESVATPLLRELSAEHSFDPSEPWAVLEGKAHNFQYGWLPEGGWAPPIGTSVFIEQLSASPGLQVYEGGRFANETTVRAMTFEPIFSGGAPWEWDQVMTHNAYAVENPTESIYEATYRIFIGDETTAVEPIDALGAPIYGSDTATFVWNATPVPEPSSLGLIAMTAFVARRSRR